MAREEARLTQAELGERLGVSHAAVSDLERGALKKVDLFDLMQIASILGKPMSYFVGEAEAADFVDAELHRAIRELEETSERVREALPHASDWAWLPLLFEVGAGSATWQEEREEAEHVPCPADLLQDASRAFAARVAGNSMAGRGILKGDIVFVDAVREPRSGDVVLAGTDGEKVLRIYKADARGAYLQSGVAGQPKLRMRDAQILGVVVGSYGGKP